jgi:hypothetical protein
LFAASTGLKKIRFQFYPSDIRRIGFCQPSDVHHQCINAILAKFGDDVHIINNHNRRVNSIDMHQPDHSSLYARQFNQHSKPTHSQRNKQSINHYLILTTQRSFWSTLNILEKHLKNFNTRIFAGEFLTSIQVFLRGV